MSRQLPTRPNLDHLKKQAKALLGDLVLNDPDAQLADALHAVAKQYGFRTWPELKTHVEALAEAAVSNSRGNPFAGTWIADLSRSTRHPANQFRRAEMHFELDADTMTIAHVMVGESGVEEKGTNAFQVDGREHPSPSGNGYSLTASWRGPRRIELVSRRNGEIVDRAAYQVSDDGMTMTISAPEQSIVLERQGG